MGLAGAVDDLNGVVGHGVAAIALGAVHESRDEVARGRARRGAAREGVVSAFVGHVGEGWRVLVRPAALDVHAAGVDGGIEGGWGADERWVGVWVVADGHARV